MKKVPEGWHDVEVAMFHTHVFLYVGARDDMRATGPDALRAWGYEDDVVDDIGESIVDVFPALDAPPVAGEVFRVNTRRSGTVTFMRLGRFEPGCVDDIAVLAHECAHVAMKILDTCGVKETGNNEVQCYLLEKLVKDFLLSLHRRAGCLEKRTVNPPWRRKGGGE